MEPLGASWQRLGGLLKSLGGLLGSSWVFLEGSQGLLGVVLEAHWASQRPPERSRRGLGTLLAAYKAPTLDVVKIIDFHCFSKGNH